MGAALSTSSKSSFCYGTINSKHLTSSKTSINTPDNNRCCCKNALKCIFCYLCYGCCCYADSGDYELRTGAGNNTRRFPEPERYVIFSRLSNKQRIFDAILRSTEQAGRDNVCEIESNTCQSHDNIVEEQINEELETDKMLLDTNESTKTKSIEIISKNKDKDADTWSVWSSSVVENPEIWHNERAKEDDIIRAVVTPLITISSVESDTQTNDVSISEAHSSPMLTPRSAKSATPSPVAHKSARSLGSQEWQHTEEDIDHLVAIHSKRNSLSNLGNRSDSMASVYSGAGEGRYGTVAVKGQVEFGLQYNYKAGALEINVKQCRDLAAVDTKRNRSDPYVKVYLLPDKSKSGKRKTKVKKHTLNPIFDECLKFHMSLSGLETRTLWLTVWHSDMFGRNDFLGEVMMTLENKVFDDPTPMWYNLQERTEPFDDLSYKGEILVGLKFVPPDMTVHKKGKRSRGSLHVLVKEAKSLTAVKANGTSDPFCKSYLLPDKGRHSKQKTSVTRRTVNPIWNHTFVYEDVTLQELAERCLELTIWDHDRLASNEFIGGVRFSLGTGKTYGKAVDWMDASGKELSLWKSMLERPNFWVEACVSLRSSLEHRTS